MKVTGILVVAGLGVCAGTCGAADRPTAEELVARAKAGPSLLLTREGAEAARRRVAADVDAGRWFNALRQRLDVQMARPPQIFAHGGQWVMWLNCRKCATRLTSESPTRHVCPACGEAHSGWPYDDAYISTVNNANGVEVRDCGVAWLLTGERRYAERARDVLAGYARAYGGYEWHQRNGPEKPGRNSAARAYAQVLDEAVWLSNLLDGYDAVREALTDADRRLIEEKLIRPSTETVRSECAYWSNHEVWHLVAFGRAGLVLGDVRLVDAALNGPYGALNQLEHGILGDGTWYEGAMHYHFYTMRAFTPFFRVLHNLGYAVPDRYRRMFLAPIEQLPPDELMPQVNDSCQLEYLHPGDLPQHYELANAWWDEPTFRWWVRQRPRATMEYALWGREDPADRTVQPPSLRSQLCGASGLAVLRTQTPGAAKRGWMPDNCLMLDFGPHGEWHGHPDKLNVFFWLHGEMASEDPGGINFGSDRHWGWYKSTLAHNTLRVDNRNQGMGEGELVAFVTNGNASAVAAFCSGTKPRKNTWDGPVYEGVDILRAVALAGDGVLDYLEADSATEHDYEWCFHSRGELVQPGDAGWTPMTNLPPRFAMDQYNLPPLLKGDESWSWVENPRQRPVGEAWYAAWRRPGATLGLWQRASSAGTLATGVGSAMPPPAQMTLAVNRLKGRRAAFASVVVPDAGARVEIGPITATADGWRGFEAKVNGRRHVLRVRRGASPRLEVE